MDIDKKHKLLRRQINDIIFQLDKIKNSEYFKSDINSLSKYSEELKSYIYIILLSLILLI